MNFKIECLTPELTPDFLKFFDNRAFCDNPDWAACYCMFYQYKAPLNTWEARTGAQNRAEAVRFIKDGRLKGYLAYIDGEPVGFCNVNEKKNLFFDKYRTESNDTGTQNIVSVVCFVIDPCFRRKGLSSLFINKVIDDYSKDFIIEAYPSSDGQENKDNYHGYSDMYFKLGFSIVKEYDKFSIVQLNQSGKSL